MARSYFDLNQRAAASLGSPAAGISSQPSLSPTPEDTGSHSASPVHPRGNLGGGSVPPARSVQSVSPRLQQPLALPVEQAPDDQRRLRAEPPWRPMSTCDQIVMYLGVVLGVVFSSAVQQFKPGGDVNLNVTLAALIPAAIVALVIIPLVFQKLSIRPDAPFIVRFGLFVQNGVFWQVIINSIGKTFAM